MDTKVFNLKKRVFLITIALVIGYFNNNFYGSTIGKDEVLNDNENLIQEDTTNKNLIKGLSKERIYTSFFSRINMTNAGWTKLIGSISYSVLNSFYNFEKITMNAGYKNIHILCFGYRWQPKFIASWDWFFDGNINIVGGFFDSILALRMVTKILRNKTPNRFFAFCILNFLNGNINIKIKETYIAINCISLIKVAVYYSCFINKKFKDTIKNISEITYNETIEKLKAN